MNYLYLGKVCAQYEPYGPPRVSVESSNRETREKHILFFESIHRNVIKYLRRENLGHWYDH